MLRFRYSTLLAILLLLALATRAHAGARLINVTPTDGACVAGPIGGSVQFWEVEPGRSYELTLSNVLDCAASGTPPTIGVRLNSSSAGNTDAVATLEADGTYKFTVTIPANALCTMPIFYCTTPGMSNTGMFVQRDDGLEFQAHLRMCTFGADCTDPTVITGTDCRLTPTRSRTWSQVKSIYR